MVEQHLLLEGALGGSRLVNRNVMSATGRTSIRLEPELWDALQEVCHREGLSVGELIRRVDLTHGDGTRTSAVRVHLVEYFRAAATEGGHHAAGHGRSSS
jgi:predicted DNA-binding ribbon-helix-helix protein